MKAQSSDKLILGHLNINPIRNKFEHSKKYENFVFIGDFNVNISDSSMKEFCSLNGLKNLINEPTCYKNSEKPTCIDLILTNQPTLFQRSAVLETGLSDFLYSQLPNLK